MKINEKYILCEKNYNDYLICSAIIEGHRLHRIYIGYTKNYAKRHFRNNLPK